MDDLMPKNRKSGRPAGKGHPQRRLLAAALLAQGRSQTEVARLTGYSLWHINRLANHDPGFMAAVEREAENLREQAAKAIELALQPMIEVLQTGEARDGLTVRAAARMAVSPWVLKLAGLY